MKAGAKPASRRGKAERFGDEEVWRDEQVDLLGMLKSPAEFL